jgi:hypothetical protein
LREAILKKEQEEETSVGVDKDADLDYAKKVVAQRSRREPASVRRPEELPYDAFKEEVPEGSRRKSRKNLPLRANEKVQIVHKVLVQKELQKDVARCHRVGATIVCRLVA